MFMCTDVRFQPADASYGVPGGVEVLLENNVLINAQSGTEEPLPEPVKRLLISSSGDLIRVLNMDQLVNYAVDTAIAQKGDISAEERQAYRDMLEKTQKGTLTRAVSCDLAFIWASWVQLWAHYPSATPHEERPQFGSVCCELEKTNYSSAAENRATVQTLISSVLGDDKNTAHDIKVELAKQEESYKTLFARDTIRPVSSSTIIALQLLCYHSCCPVLIAA